MIGIVLLAASWVGAWSAAPSSVDTHVTFTNVTLREIVHAGIGGSAIRIRLTNRFGDAPLSISAVSIATAKTTSEPLPLPSTMHRVTFSGATSVTIPPHADVVSDTVAFSVHAQSDLLVSLYVPGPTSAPTYHHLSYQDNFSASGDRVDQQSGDAFSQTYRNWYLFDGIDVLGTTARGAIAVLGDSITNGQGSTVNVNNRWTDDLQKRLTALHPAASLSVLNEAIDGDRIVLDSPRFGPSALTRFDTDVLSVSGIQDVMVLMGINDIQEPPHEYDARMIEFGLEQIAQRAHMRALRVIVCTITPYEGWLTYDPRGEQTRLALNAFIRSSHLFDGVADFDAVIRDRHDVHRLRAEYDSGDHLHPNAAAYKAMASSVNLGLFME